MKLISFKQNGKINLGALENDMIYYPEYIITKSEIYSKNNNIKKA